MAHEKFPGGASEGPLDRFDLPLLSIQPQDAIRCLRAGKHVLAGTPPALTNNDLDRGLEAASESGQSCREMGPAAFVQPRDIVFGGQIGEVVQIFSQKSYPDHDGRPPDGNIDGGRCCFRSESLPHDGSSLSADNPSHRSKPSKPKSETRDRARSAWSSASKGI